MLYETTLTMEISDMKIDQSRDQTGPNFGKFIVGGNLCEVTKKTRVLLRNLVLLNQICVLNLHFILRDILPF